MSIRSITAISFIPKYIVTYIFFYLVYNQENFHVLYSWIFSWIMISLFFVVASKRTIFTRWNLVTFQHNKLKGNNFMIFCPIFSTFFKILELIRGVSSDYQEVSSNWQSYISSKNLWQSYIIPYQTFVIETKQGNLKSCILTTY